MIKKMRGNLSHLMASERRCLLLIISIHLNFCKDTFFFLRIVLLFPFFFVNLQNKMKFMMKRIEWIDTAKGICIFLVVINHLCLYSGVLSNGSCSLIRVNDFLSSFRMPLYFFLSGLFFKTYGGGKFFSSRRGVLLTT